MQSVRLFVCGDFPSLHVGHFVSRLVGERLAAFARARKRSDVTRGHMWAKRAGVQALRSDAILFRRRGHLFFLIYCFLETK